MSEEDTRFDGLFMSVLQQRQNIGLFFESIFGFLRRQSDFFQNQKSAEEVIVKECKKQYDRFLIDQQNKAKEEQAKKDKEAAREAAKKKALEEQQKKQEEQQQVQQQQQQVQSQAVVQAPTEGGEKKEDDEKPPVGNGGKTDKYIWTQTLDEVQIFVPIPEGTRGKQLSVQITGEGIQLGLLGQPPLIKGEFYERIGADGAVWTVTDGQIQDYKGRYVHVTLEKWKNQMHWWDCVVKGDPKINTQKINPEPSRLDELEGETRGTVEKMMFDMRQKQAGLPTSDELEKKNKLAEFMKAHPEMDFSKCKFN